MSGKNRSLVLAFLIFHTAIAGKVFAGPSRGGISASTPPRIQPAESFRNTGGDGTNIGRGERARRADVSAALAVSTLKALAKRTVRRRGAGSRNSAELIRELNNCLGRAPDRHAKTK